MAWFFGQSLLYVALAFLLGLLVGWLTWGRTRSATPESSGVAERPEPTAPVIAEPLTATPAATPETATPAAPAAEPKTEAEPAPVAVAADPEPEPVTVADAEPVAEPEPVAVADVEPEPVAVAAAVRVPEPVAEPEPAGEVAPALIPADKPDNLQRIEGIGPKISTVLVAAGIRTYEQLASSDQATLARTLRQGGLRSTSSLTTWGAQAALLAKGDETGFAEFTRELVASRKTR